MNESRRAFLRHGLLGAFGGVALGGPSVDERAQGLPFDPGFRAVTEFGAVGDGRTDDTDAFDAALAEGAPVYVPAGSYVITRPLAPLGSQTLLRGTGIKSRIIYRGADFALRTAPRSEYVEIGGLTVFLTHPGGGAIHLRNTHYARLMDLWIFGYGTRGVQDLTGIRVDAPFPPGGYWAQGSNILLRGLNEGFRIDNGANATVWQNVTIRETVLPVAVHSGYGFQLIGGFIEGWGAAGAARSPAIFARGDSGVILGVVFEEVKPHSYIVEFADGARGWVILGRFNVAGGITIGEGGSNVLINTSHHRVDNLMVRAGGRHRPRNPDPYDVYFDQELGKPIWWDGTRWVDAMGQPV